MSKKDYSILATSNMSMAATMIGFAIAVLAIVPILTLPQENQLEKEVLTSLSVVCIFLFCLSVLFYNLAAATGANANDAKITIKKGNTLFLSGLILFLAESVFLVWVLKLHFSAILGFILLVSFLGYVLYKKN